MYHTKIVHTGNFEHSVISILSIMQSTYSTERSSSPSLYIRSTHQRYLDIMRNKVYQFKPYRDGTVRLYKKYFDKIYNKYLGESLTLSILVTFERQLLQLSKEVIISVLAHTQKIYYIFKSDPFFLFFLKKEHRTLRPCFALKLFWPISIQLHPTVLR